MAGNSSRRGATRKGGKKGATVGTGGHSRKALEGKGPTPKAEDRPYHTAHKKKVAAERRVAGARGTSGRPAASASRSAAGSKGGRKSSTHEIVSGRNSVLEAMRTGVPVTTLYLAAKLEADDRTREIVSTAADAGYPLLEVSRTELDRLTDGSVHQGVAIQVPPYAYAEDEDLLDIAARAGVPVLAVALDGVTDPRNLGAVLRSAGAFGAHGVIVPERRAAGVTAAAWKVSAGAAARVPVARVTNLARTLQEWKKAGVFVVGLDGGGDVAVADLPYAGDPLVVVVGSEGKGLSRLVREQCDAIASIPISSEVESLNAGVAAGIALYEVARHRA
ncbi:MAG: 23S rRNA (guanosine(2251)-2'-O)-methyltransferase RlmB [Cellulomonas sp.]|uniref:23S rRNA (Guanosine(2251)-2'-O)-methyltransferase RlmB n=1 Tax=Cellulomonas gelida TaxID=1712 RepID=A0A4Y3KNI1_9CELL|nr:MULTISPECIES: 23S rRNA (guanosine(2251)-2'-O)-methyltransferase RlmB [Cellulomonas]KMM47023.1 RNA methyltransferase [Cellulomonas sp. A375-1]MCR6649529.1 23S rRNA (guanosine(2251)-2'-O)-methyltransferase RlmB [Cellulomonas sp.]MCR6705499.1 23S rRNA (guanosine(2251)-2'-O)-methyltransferase RlmB [Cellulomonas sp.]GEA85602.1 23S rRNA (guanosine(2251)-2'-O)-methyltransferase RlmB [Cellulomonas gelida]GGL17448.1 23S rRNA (guanosine(2251)-2'-O)-methyltransferase RlmB [Cellulomonas gelida]